MTTQSLPHDPTAILTAVESFFDALPEKRRRKRTHAEIYGPQDDTPETENYTTATAAAESTITIELDGVAQAVLPVLLGQSGEARSTAMVQFLTLKIYELLGLKVDSGK